MIYPNSLVIMRIFLRIRKKEKEKHLSYGNVRKFEVGIGGDSPLIPILGG